MIDELQVGDEVEILFPCDVYGKQGKIVRVSRWVYTVSIDNNDHHFSERDSLRKIEKKDTCTCDKFFLFNNGCKCGHLERTRNANVKV